jgi:tRNA(Arg) A34 adenosine deaminase TadA
MKVAGRSEAVQRHGCVLVRGGRVIGIGINRYVNQPYLVSPEHAKAHCSVHAEVAALRAAGTAARATAYVARVNPRGEPMLSAPCPACAASLAAAGVRRVVHT